MKMKRIFLAALGLILMAGDLCALEVKGVPIDPAVTLQGQTLQLNGVGIRKKFFMAIYVGSLYTAKRVSSGEEAALDGGGKLIRMNFLYDKLDRQKIVESFAEGLAANSPDLQGAEDVTRFLSWFSKDFVRGDVVDLELAGDGTVSARHNGALLGRLKSPALARGVLLIYLGKKPADNDLKSGMLGRD